MPAWRLALSAGALGCVLAHPAAAQLPPPETGAVAAGLLLRQLDGVKRVLVIGAHPDDEDTSLLTVLARGRGARAAYLSLSRGEGGQNLIGPELGEELGIVRTGELLAARRLDGAEQFFTRAYDFGYSKTAEEAFRHWPRDSVLRDVVWVVRRFRPQVLVTVFSGTPRDGHGQHQIAGIVAREAFRAAGDPNRFPEQLAEGVEPWAPAKLYRRTFRDPEAATLIVETGRLDPLLGRSYHQVAMASRSQHRSQDFGVAQSPGPFSTRLQLLESRVHVEADTDLFAGVDTTLAGLVAAFDGSLRPGLERSIRAYRAALEDARRSLSPLAPEAAAPPLARALKALRDAISTVEGQEGASTAIARNVLRELRRQERLAQEALAAAASVALVARADDDVVVPGEGLVVEVDLWNGGPLHASARPAALSLPAGWKSSDPVYVPWRRPRLFAFEPPGENGAAPEPDRGGPLAPGQLRRSRFGVEVSARAEPSQLYYLRLPRARSLYRWPPAPELRGRPRDPPPMVASVEFELDVPGEGPIRLRLERPVRFRGVDKAKGEFWRPVLVSPSVAISVEPGVLVWPVEDTSTRTLHVTLTAADRAGASGSVALELPRGWRVDPPERGFTLPSEGATAIFAFDVSPPPAGPASGRVQAAAVVRRADGSRLSRTVRLIAYEHIEPALYLKPAAATIRRFPLRVARGRRVGYLMGSGDAGPEAIRQLGLQVDLLEPDLVAAGAFEPYDVIVLGIRAYETRPDLRAANRRLLDWVRAGGTLIVQYNKHEIVEGSFAPYELEMKPRADRVTDETSPVRLLDPSAPPLAAPNRITGEDFDEWVQERGLYFPSAWAPEYVPLLAMRDPGEEELKGALLVAQLGRGVYVYTSLSLFRQLPAGVPGAYRLLANLLSLDGRTWSEYARKRREG